MCACVWRPEVMVACLPSPLSHPTLICATKCYTELRIHACGCVGWPECLGVPLLSASPPILGRCVLPCSLFHRCRGLNSDRPGCTASTLPLGDLHAPHPSSMYIGVSGCILNSYSQDACRTFTPVDTTTCAMAK